MPTPLPISVCMISGPDSARIGRALKSVQGWVAETIVVVNDDVTDGTDKIAQPAWGQSIPRIMERAYCPKELGRG